RRRRGRRRRTLRARRARRARRRFRARRDARNGSGGDGCTRTIRGREVRPAVPAPDDRAPRGSGRDVGAGAGRRAIAGDPHTGARDHRRAAGRDRRDAGPAEAELSRPVTPPGCPMGTHRTPGSAGLGTLLAAPGGGDGVFAVIAVIALWVCVAVLLVVGWRRFADHRGWRVAVLFGALLVATVHQLAYGTVPDEAHIGFRYARNIADGYGAVFNPGEYVEGYT